MHFLTALTRIRRNSLPIRIRNLSLGPSVTRQSSVSISAMEKSGMDAVEVWKEGSRRLDEIWTAGMREL